MESSASKPPDARTTGKPTGEPSGNDGPIGVDIGGTGCKAAHVDVAAGELASARQRIDTPHPATPGAVASVVEELIGRLGGSPNIGLTVPAVVRGGVVRSAANIDRAWIGTDARALFGERLGCTCTVLNDADAAGIAEMRFGAGKGRSGVVVVVTLGTGIGTAVFTDGVLVPNTELGHLELKGGDAEKYAAESIRVRDDLSWHKWGHHVGRYLRVLEKPSVPGTDHHRRWGVQEVRPLRESGPIQDVGQYRDSFPPSRSTRPGSSAQPCGHRSHRGCTDPMTCPAPNPDATPTPPPTRQSLTGDEPMSAPTAALHELGQSLWLDNITRKMLDDGVIQYYIDEYSVTGLTSNPSIFDKAVQGGGYDDAIREKSAAGAVG